MANPCDTGASHSLTGDISALCHFRKLMRPIPLSVATNTAKQSFVTGVGSLIYPGYCGKHVIINGVFYSPDASSTLISPGALANAGANLLFVGMDILIGTKAEGPLLRVVYNGNGQKWQLTMFSILLACSIDNHDIPSQPSSSVPQSENITTISIPLAPICAMTANKHQTAFTSLNSRYTTVCTASLPNVYDVILYPQPTATINRGPYTLNICDVSSTYGECHILANKSDATICLQDTILCWKRLSVKWLKILRTENGGKLNNNVLERWLRNEGIYHERSLPSFHQQNGVSKHYNRTVADMSRTIILGSGLPKSFWGHAFMWASYTNNVIPNLHTGNQLLVEILFGTKPSLD
ncbi:hypothetical protein O181_014224 [Austropuccinia psidii MF-1]|uniref:Integrase catalytic domain-containing protein n=1 Tax=Austropuccinia psidii MF-1 TaxID=1389203 RepID=A0A9Q3BXR8_9BASI|nr:hypothetical protein [Austropuccinia psidii MF-1]